MTDRITIKDVASELRRQGGHPPLCYWVNLRGDSWGWRKPADWPGSWELPEDEAVVKIAAWLSDDMNTTAGRLRLEAAHRRRVQSGNRKVYLHQARVRLLGLADDELQPLLTQRRELDDRITKINKGGTGNRGLLTAELNEVSEQIALVRERMSSPDYVDLERVADEFEARQIRYDIATFVKRIDNGIPGVPRGVYQRFFLRRDRRSLQALRERLVELSPLVPGPEDLILVQDVSAGARPAKTTVAEYLRDNELLPTPKPRPLDWRPKGREGWYYEVAHHAGFQRIVAVDKPGDSRLKFFGQALEFIPDPIPLGPVSIAKERLYGKKSRWQARLTQDEIKELI